MENSCRIFLRAVICWGQASMITSVSSTYCKIGKSSLYWREIGSFSRFCVLAWFTILCNKSEAKTYKRGDKGSPYLTPRLQWKTLPATPFKRTGEVLDEKNKLHPRKPSVSKSFVLHYTHHSLMLYFIKCFFKIQFENNEFLSGLMTHMQIFKSPCYTILNCSTLNKTILILVNNLLNELLESIC